MFEAFCLACCSLSVGVKNQLIVFVVNAIFGVKLELIIYNIGGLSLKSRQM